MTDELEEKTVYSLFVGFLDEIECHSTIILSHGVGYNFYFFIFFLFMIDEYMHVQN